MATHLLFSEGLTVMESHRAIAETYLGQAHIAGTGPEGKTCRECAFWYLKKHKKDASGNYVEVRASPGYFGKKHKTQPLDLKKAKCNRPILNKANRQIPHCAKACRLFEHADNPVPAKKPQL